MSSLNSFVRFVYLTLIASLHLSAGQNIGFGNPDYGLAYNPYTSAANGYGLGSPYSTVQGSMAANYLYGGAPVGPPGFQPQQLPGYQNYNTYGPYGNYPSSYGYGYNAGNNYGLGSLGTGNTGYGIGSGQGYGTGGAYGPNYGSGSNLYGPNYGSGSSLYGSNYGSGSNLYGSNYGSNYGTGSGFGSNGLTSSGYQYQSKSGLSVPDSTTSLKKKRSTDKVMEWLVYYARR